jgi:hypothetical protein
MESNTQTPTEQPPQTNPPARGRVSPLRYYARAIASESRRFYYSLTRENIAAFLRTFTFAAPLTILIWVYAESEQQVPDTDQPISIEITSRDPNKMVTLDPGEHSITCDLRGPRSNLDRFKTMLSPTTPIVIELDTRQMTDRDDYISTLDNLRKSPQFREAGITIEKCEPAMLRVYVDTVLTRSLPVKPPPDVPGLQDASFNPPTITVTGPSRFLKSFNEVTADISSLPALDQPGVHQVDNVSLDPDPSGALAYKPTQVKAVLTVAQKDVTKPFSVPIWVATTPRINNDYIIAVNGSGFTPQLELTGPSEQLDRINKDVIPKALLEIDDANVNTTTPVQLKIEGLPDGVHLAGPPPEITFTATHR